MYNEFDPKHYKGKWPCTTKTLIGKLHQYFLIYFETFSVPTADTLFLLILSILTSESAHSIRFLYQHFLSGITEKSLNVFYYACSYAKADYSRFMNTTVRIALNLIPDYRSKHHAASSYNLNHSIFYWHHFRYKNIPYSHTFSHLQLWRFRICCPNFPLYWKPIHMKQSLNPQTHRAS